MKKNYLHTGNTTKKSSARAKLVFCAFNVVAAVTLAGFALAAGPERPSVRSSKSQIVAENPDASNNHGSGKNPIAEKYDTLVMRVYFRDRAERDRLAQELSAEEVPTTGGYLTVIGDRDRSEERRVGKEWRCRRPRGQSRKKRRRTYVISTIVVAARYRP